MTRTSAFAVGVLFVPLVAAVVLASFTRMEGRLDPITGLGLIPIFYFFALMATVVFGMPAFFLLAFFKAIRSWSLTGVGALVGALLACLLRLPAKPEANDFVVMVPIGAISAFAFWMIWRRAE